LGAACGAQQLNQRAQQLSQKKALNQEVGRWAAIGEALNVFNAVALPVGGISSRFY
jgi:hypothetical protein